LDRWGNILYSITNCPIDAVETCFWDGKREGEQLDVGVYVYYASLLLTDGTTIESSGNISLVGALGER